MAAICLIFLKIVAFFSSLCLKISLLQTKLFLYNVNHHFRIKEERLELINTFKFKKTQKYN